MHLSPLSDGFLSSGFDEPELPHDACRAHRDGLLRGLALLGILSVLMGFAFVSSAIHAADAAPAPSTDDPIHCAINAR